MELRISVELQASIDRLIASGSYADTNDVLEAGLRLLIEREDRLAWLRAELAKGERQEQRGETIPFTRDTMKRLMQEAEERFRLGLPIKEAVRPPD